MAQDIRQVALVVADYDDAIAFYTAVLGFDLIEDTPLGDGKRWVVVAPKGSGGCRLLLARGVGERQLSRVGDQTGGRVFMFLETDDFDRDFESYSRLGVEFVRGPSVEPYGKVAVFADLYGNLWDLIEYSRPPQEAG